MKNRSVVAAVIIMTVLLSSCSILNKNKVEEHPNLAGSWELTYITGPRIAFEGLYPETKPTIEFDLDEKRVNGVNSCNSYGGELNISKGNSIKFEKLFTTMMACEGSGEAVYMETLKKIKTFKVDENTLSFFMDNIEMMRFVKK